MKLSIAFVSAFGELSEGFLSDALLAILCARAERAGHAARLVHVYYDGRSSERDAEIARRLSHDLEVHGTDIVVVERLFDPDPIRAHRARGPNRRAILVTRGDSFEPIEGVDWLVGATSGLTHGGTRRSPTTGELCNSFERLVEAIAEGRPETEIAGAARLRDGDLVHGPASVPAPLPRPFEATLRHDVIASGDPPSIRRRTIFGNAGCPFSDDPAAMPHFAGLSLSNRPERAPLARLGCAFCCMGGDYQKRPDAEVIAEIVEQATFYADHDASVEEFVLTDQYPLRYLAALLRAVGALRTRPMRWLFASRVDAFVREESRVRDAIAAAAEIGHRIELYLSGFEAFRDGELARYNKGCSTADQLRAIEAMRALRTSHPGVFDYQRARGHSLVLWNPWTAPEDVGGSVATIREHGLGELFHELGRNRLRLYPDLPLYAAAARDGALSERWDGDDEGAARRKGYNVEHPWRFLDPRTRLAYELARRMRERLGSETEVGQLTAATQFAAQWNGSGSVEDIATEVLAGVDALDRILCDLSAERGPDRAPRASNEPAAPVSFAGACNNGCASCAQRDVWLDDGEEALLERVQVARQQGRAILLCGREPTIHASFLRIVSEARGADDRSVAVISNGRRFSYAEFSKASVKAGLATASIKVFAPDGATADAIASVPGAFAQTLAGIRMLSSLGVAIELRVPIAQANLGGMPQYAPLAKRLGLRQIRLEATLDAIGLSNLGEASKAIERLARAAAGEGLAVTASPLAAGSRLFDRIVGDSSTHPSRFAGIETA